MSKRISTGHLPQQRKKIDTVVVPSGETFEHTLTGEVFQTSTTDGNLYITYLESKTKQELAPTRTTKAHIDRMLGLGLIIERK